MKLIIGLGNVGDQYINTRHNVGFRVLDAIAKKCNIEIKKNKFDSLIFVNDDFILLKPQTYMNLSGNAVKKVIDLYKVSLANILVICDEINIPVGQAKIRISSSSGGHNGVKNIIEKLETSDFYRLKIGVGSSEMKEGNLADFVLGEFSESEKQIIDKVVDKAAEAVMSYIYNDINYVINNFNKKD